MPRQLSNWIEAFLEYTQDLPSPEVFRRWAAYSTLSGALERRCWTRAAGSELYPNLFVLLVGPPGSGKTFSIREVGDLWKESGAFNVAPTTMTKAAWVDQLKEKTKMFKGPAGEPITYHALLVPSSEFGTLMPSHDLEFLSNLNEVYDCPPDYTERVRYIKTPTKIYRPHMSLIAGVQPKFLGHMLPEAAYGQGFTSRIVMVYAAKRELKPIFDQEDETPIRPIKLKKALLSDLINISGLSGEFVWDRDAKEAVEDWNVTYVDDAPTHPKLQSYVERRVIHGVKLTMAIAASKISDSLRVTLDDFNTAREALIEVENLMPEIFKEMTVSVDAHEIDEAHRFLFAYCDKHERETCPESTLVQFFAGRVPVNKINYFLDTMLNAGLMENKAANLEGHRRFKPIPLRRM